jgi:methyl-accepting chemotaxis protein
MGEDGLLHIETSHDCVSLISSVLAAASGSVAEVGKGLDEIVIATVEQRRMAADVSASIEQITALARDNSVAATDTLYST